jgi:hypothetical protein
LAVHFPGADRGECSGLKIMQNCINYAVNCSKNYDDSLTYKK